MSIVWPTPRPDAVEYSRTTVSLSRTIPLSGAAEYIRANTTLSTTVTPKGAVEYSSGSVSMPPIKPAHVYSTMRVFSTSVEPEPPVDPEPEEPPVEIDSLWKYWDGAQQRSVKAKVWVGDKWQETVRVWDGTKWIPESDPQPEPEPEPEPDPESNPLSIASAGLTVLKSIPLDGALRISAAGYTVLRATEE